MVGSTPLSSPAWAGGNVRPFALGAIAFPWGVHASTVLLSALGVRPLGSAAAATATLLLAGAATTWLVVWLRRAARSRDAPSLTPSDRALTVVLAVAGALAFVFALWCAVAWPIVSYDALGYRLPTIASWLDAGRVAWVSSDDPVRNGYPMGQETIAAVLAAATGTFRFAAATSFVFVAAGALSLWMLAEESGVRPAFARASAALFVLVPMVTLNASSGYVDAAFAGAMVALLACAARISTEKNAEVPVLAGTGMAAAHVMALKGNGVVFAGIVGVALLGRALVARRRVAPLALPLALALPGAFWVVRNVLETGNPFWPVRMEARGKVVFKGVATLPQILDVAHNTPPEFVNVGGVGRVLRAWLELSGPATDFDTRTAGLGLAFVLLAVPAVVWFLLRGAREGMPVARSRLAFIAGASLVCFAIQPMNWWPRYTVWLWGAGALALVFSLEALSRASRPRALTALLAGVVLLSVPEGTLAAVHANGAWTAMSNTGLGAIIRALDVRHAPNVRRWVDPAFWHHDFERGDVCRGAWKPNTDNANLDGVFAQIKPRPRVHVIIDDASDWPTVRAAYRALGCRRILLFPGSPALIGARQDTNVQIDEIVAFDPLFLVRTRDSMVLSNLE